MEPDDHCPAHWTGHGGFCGVCEDECVAHGDQPVVLERVRVGREVDETAVAAESPAGDDIAVQHGSPQRGGSGWSRVGAGSRVTAGAGKRQDAVPPRRWQAAVECRRLPLCQGEERGLSMSPTDGALGLSME
jgi:hypothetical protein